MDKSRLPVEVPQRLHAALVPPAPSHAHTALDIVKGIDNVVTVTLVPEGLGHPDMEIRALVAINEGNHFAGPYRPGVTFNTPFVIPAGADSGLLRINASRSLQVGTYLALLLAAPAGVPSAASTIELFALSVKPPA